MRWAGLEIGRFCQFANKVKGFLSPQRHRAHRGRLFVVSNARRRC